MIYTGMESLPTNALISRADEENTPIVAELTARLYGVWEALDTPADVVGEIGWLIKERDSLQVKVDGFDGSVLSEVRAELEEALIRIKNAEARIATRDKKAEKLTEEILNLKIQLKQAAAKKNDVPSTVW